MRFDTGFLSRVGDISDYPQTNRWLATAKLAEDLGYHGLWAAEHHFAWDEGITPTTTNPLQLGAFIASATQRVRIGQCGCNLTASHPLRIAEDAATLDHMCEGRMEFGFMKGLSGKVSTQFDPNTGVKRDHAKTNGAFAWEAFEVIKRFWSGEPFRFDGQYFTFPVPWDNSFTPSHLRDPQYYDKNGILSHIRGLPTPRQTPLPPCWTMIDSVSSHFEAAKRGVGAIGWAQTFEGTRERLDAYRRGAQEAFASGDMPAGANLRCAMMRPTFVAPIDAEAEAALRPAINGLFDKIFGLDNWLGRESMLASWETLTEEEKTCDWYDFFDGREQIIVGSPRRVVDRLKKYESIGMYHLIQYWSMPHLTFEQQHESLKLFATEVMPHFPLSVDTPTVDPVEVHA